MSHQLLDSLPLAQRLALSYAPKGSRGPTLALMALEQRLAAIVAGDGEPMIAQIKLAWWRDRLSEDPANWPSGEPLLATLRNFPGDLDRFVPMVDGYEAFLGEAFDRPALATYLRGKSLAWGALADAVATQRPVAPVELAAKEIALFDLANRLSDQAEIALVADAAGKQPWKAIRLSRNMRPLAVHHALTRRARKKGQFEPLAGPGAMLTAMRVGITGR